MTIAKTLRQHLSKLDAGGCHFSSDGWDVTLVTDKSDSLSCALKELRLDRAAPIQEALNAWAQRIALRATGLMEPLRLVEEDRSLGKAILRSDSPLVQENKTFYYELVLERTKRTLATLHRYACDRQNGERREAVPFALTHDAIVKLVSDIVGAN
jgi:hypothetical protein